MKQQQQVDESDPLPHCHNHRHSVIVHTRQMPMATLSPSSAVSPALDGLMLLAHQAETLLGTRPTKSIMQPHGDPLLAASRKAMESTIGGYGDFHLQAPRAGAIAGQETLDYKMIGISDKMERTHSVDWPVNITRDCASCVGEQQFSPSTRLSLPSIGTALQSVRTLEGWRDIECADGRWHLDRARNSPVESRVTSGHFAESGMALDARSREDLPPGQDNEAAPCDKDEQSAREEKEGDLSPSEDEEVFMDANHFGASRGRNTTTKQSYHDDKCDASQNADLWWRRLKRAQQVKSSEARSNCTSLTGDDFSFIKTEQECSVDKSSEIESYHVKSSCVPRREAANHRSCRLRSKRPVDCCGSPLESHNDCNGSTQDPVRQVKNRTKKFYCEFCKKQFSNAETFTRHTMTHNGRRTHRCDHCSRSFYDEGSFKRHCRSHTGEKAHKCGHCSMAFGKRSALKVHLRTHTGERPYECQHCGKGFSISGNLHRHLLIHSGLRPYKCGKCPKAFNNPSHLARHISSIHTSDIGAE